MVPPGASETRFKLSTCSSTFSEDAMLLSVGNSLSIFYLICLLRIESFITEIVSGQQIKILSKITSNEFIESHSGMK
jgi:hypothetical protein